MTIRGVLPNRGLPRDDVNKLEFRSETRRQVQIDCIRRKDNDANQGSE